jgi:branched-chain amino acid transport system ATP-binding protein
VDLLSVEGLGRRYAGVEALRDVHFRVVAGDRVGIIGPNGAGKTTLLNCLVGMPPATSGQIMFKGRDITAARTHAIVGLGIARSFQAVNLLAALSVSENALLAVSGRRRMKYNMLRRLTSFGDVRAEADALLDRAGLTAKSDHAVENLSYGEQRRLDVILALAGSPELVLLDEPSAGLTEAETQEIGELIRGLPADVTVMLIDHDVDLVFGIAERVIVLNQGSIIADGDPDEIRTDTRVRDVYFGASATHA